MAWTQKLTDLDACSDAVKFAETQPDINTAWKNCERADWMLWLAAHTLPRPLVVQLACDCAETSLDFIRDGSTLTTAIFALHIAREWAEGREDLETVRGARAAAAAAASAAASADAYASAYAAAADAAAAAAAAAAADAYADAAAAAASAYA